MASKLQNQKALDAFVETMSQVRKEIALLQQEANMNFGNINPDKINWAHVGDASRVLELLKQIRNSENA